VSPIRDKPPLPHAGELQRVDVGADHRPWMAAEVGDLGVAVLRAVKQTLDPVGILNPGKLIP